MCMSNTKQLALAWVAYSHDNNDTLVVNDDKSGLESWCAGELNWGTSSDNTNTLFLSDDQYALLASYYARQFKLHKCPADMYASDPQRALGWSSRARSISMNAAMGPGRKHFAWCDEIRKMSSLVQPPPAMAWVFVDEHPDSINDPMLYINRNLPLYNAEWVDWPASYHDGACGFSFADGHSEIHKWRDSRTRAPVRYTSINNMVVGGSMDYGWIAQRTP